MIVKNTKSSRKACLPAIAEALEDRRMLTSDFNWGVGTGYEDVLSSANYSVNDANGNTYVAGIFRGKVNFANANQAPYYVNSDQAKDDVFVAKYRHDGALLWARRIGGPRYETVTALTLGNDGALYLSGTFQSKITIATKPNATPLTTRGDDDAYIVRLSIKTGMPVWAGQVGGELDDSITGITVDSAGRLYISGWVRRAGNIAPTGKAVYISNSRGVDDTFIERLDPANGKLLWYKVFGENTTRETVMKMVADPINGGIIASGMFNDTVQFDRSSSKFTRKSVKSYDIYIASLAPDGKFRYVRQFGAKHEDHLSDMIVVPNSGHDDYDLYFTGVFDKDINLSADPKHPKTLEADYDVSVYISHMNSDGSIVWVGQIGGDGAPSGTALAVDATGNIYLAGAITDDTYFDPNAIAEFRTVDKDKGGVVPGQYDSSDAYLLKLDPDGNFLNVDQFAGPNGSIALYDLGVTASGAAYLVGQYVRTVDIDPGSGKFKLTTASRKDTSNILVMSLLTGTPG